jgi:hypothetical protein
MATITLERVSKVYPNGFQAVNEVDLTVAPVTRSGSRSTWPRCTSSIR